MERIEGSAPVLLKPTDVARQLGLSKPMVYKMAATGELPSIGFGRAIRFDPADVVAFIQARRRDRRSS